jgi:hypothetical protein
MQLGGNLLTLQDWANVIIHMVNSNVTTPDDWHGSHGCGNGDKHKGHHEDNGACASLLCLIWESRTNNSNPSNSSPTFRIPGDDCRSQRYSMHLPRGHYLRMHRRLRATNPQGYPRWVLRASRWSISMPSETRPTRRACEHKT